MRHPTASSAWPTAIVKRFVKTREAHPQGLAERMDIEGDIVGLDPGFMSHY